MRGIRRRDSGGPGDYTNPASESIDEALARLARQDTRLNPVPPPGARRRALGPSRITRDRILVLARWLIILAIAWAIWRFGLGGR